MSLDKSYDMGFEELKDWCLLVLDFIESKHSPSILGNLKEDVNLAYENGDFRPLKTLYRDLNEWVSGFPIVYQTELNDLLLTKFGRLLNEYAIKSISILNKIIKKGKIENEDEYRIVMARIDQIYDDSTKKDELQKLNQLLFNHDSNINLQ